MADWSELSPELLNDIHGRLRLLSRLAFAAVCVSWRDVHRATPAGARKPEAPWLVLPDGGRRSARLFSLADGRAVSVHVPRPPMRSRVVVGSSGGWLVTADYWQSRLHLLNPFTGEQAELPALTTMQCLDAAPGGKVVFDFADYTLIRLEDSSRWRPSPPETYSPSHLRHLFLRKVILSPSTRPPGGYEAMLLQCLGSGPAFATARDGEWTLAPSPHGVEDAIYHDGQFFSVASTGVVESWRDIGCYGMYRSTVVTSKLAKEDDWEMWKYLVESPAGQLMMVFREHDRDGKSSFFKVEILDEARGIWEEVPDIGDAALFVGINESLCLSTTEHPELRASCVYFTDDNIYAWMAKREPRDVGVYSLKDGIVKQIEALGPNWSWPPAAWITPCLV
ncbi:hypothetical protein ACP70R_005195 [Stipagrostis hirtigluma subsp. patula]